MSFHEYEDHNGKLQRKRGNALGRYNDAIITAQQTPPVEELQRGYEGALRFFAYKGFSIEFLTGADLDSLLAKNEFANVALWAMRTWGTIHMVGLGCTPERAKEISEQRMKEFKVKI